MKGKILSAAIVISLLSIALLYTLLSQGIISIRLGNDSTEGTAADSNSLRSTESTTANLENISATLNQLLIEIQSMQQRQQELRLLLKQGRVAGTPASDVENIEISDIQNKALPNATQAASLNQFTSTLDDTVVSEDVDPQWAEQVTHRITSVASKEKYQHSQITSLNCRSSLCKIGVQHESALAEKQFNGSFTREAGFHNSDTLYIRDLKADGSVNSTIYVSRNGSALPNTATN